MDRRPATATVLPLLALAVAACGSSSGGAGDGSSARAAPSAADFPAPKGRSMAELRATLPRSGPILAPTVQQLDPGRERYGFGLFTSDRKQLSGVPVALYVQRSGSRKLAGPYPARDEPLTVAPPYRSKTVAQDPDAAKSLYVTRLPFPRPGAYAVMAVARRGGRLVGSDPIPAHVLARDPVPNVGDRAPVIDTPTVASVAGEVGKIDTRQPPDDMHAVDFADVVGKRPVMLLFATPALCQSRVCGPVVDIAEEVKSQTKTDAAFIHMEIYRDNTIKPGCLEGHTPESQCLRPQVLAYHLQTEPWLFAIDRHGRVAARLEGAFSKRELEKALKAAVGG